MTIKKLIEPDGYCAWHPKKGFVKELFRAKEAEAEFQLCAAWNPLTSLTGLQHEDDFPSAQALGWLIKPVCLVSPELIEWVQKFKTYIECVQRDRSVVDFLGQTQDTTEEDYLLDLLNKILPERVA